MKKILLLLLITTAAFTMNIDGEKFGGDKLNKKEKKDIKLFFENKVEKPEVLGQTRILTIDGSEISQNQILNIKNLVILKSTGGAGGGG